MLLNSCSFSIGSLKLPPWVMQPTHTLGLVWFGMAWQGTPTPAAHQLILTAHDLSHLTLVLLWMKWTKSCYLVFIERAIAFFHVDALQRHFRTPYCIPGIFADFTSLVSHLCRYDSAFLSSCQVTSIYSNSGWKMLALIPVSLPAIPLFRRFLRYWALVLPF